MIRIDLDSPIPLEHQIAAALRQALARGDAFAGEELPSARQLAADLGVHWNTVARAYRKLSDEGLLVVRRGRTAVVRGANVTSSSASRTQLRERIAEAITVGRLGGLTKRQIADVFRQELTLF